LRRMDNVSLKLKVHNLYEGKQKMGKGRIGHSIF